MEVGHILFVLSLFLVFCKSTRSLTLNFGDLLFCLLGFLTLALLRFLVQLMYKLLLTSLLTVRKISLLNIIICVAIG